ncbi:hypothetical protein Syun_001923 [Stephania yunnanensis]|uniref:Protein kinase domain-containing protein n=1 Tax=Stephania yunnanensis TaxID=152371 RepID=A0AAP0LEN3_9MAGN
MFSQISDFGLVKMMPENQEMYVTTKVLGTFGYFDLEYISTRKLTIQSDICAFGVVLLELLTGRIAVDLSQGPNDQNLVLQIPHLLWEAKLSRTPSYRYYYCCIPISNGKCGLRPWIDTTYVTRTQVQVSNASPRVKKWERRCESRKERKRRHGSMCSKLLTVAVKGRLDLLHSTGEEVVDPSPEIALSYTGLNLDVDSHIFMKEGLLEILMRFYYSPVADYESKILILQISLKKCIYADHEAKENETGGE